MEKLEKVKKCERYEKCDKYDMWNLNIKQYP